MEARGLLAFILSLTEDWKVGYVTLPNEQKMVENYRVEMGKCTQNQGSNLNYDESVTLNRKCGKTALNQSNGFAVGLQTSRTATRQL